MKREDIFDSDVQWIENWVQRIESFSSLECVNIRSVWNQKQFTKKQLIDAYKEDCNWFRGFADEIMRLCPNNYAIDEIHKVED